MEEVQGNENEIENLLQEDVVIQMAMERTKQDEVIVQPIVNEFLERIVALIDNPDENFDLRHGFLILGKSINYLSQSLCKDEAQFKEEITNSHMVVVDKFMGAISPEMDENNVPIEGTYDEENFSIRRLMMMSGSLIDYVYWRDALSTYAEQREKLEAEAK